MSEQIPFLELRPQDRTAFHIRPLRSYMDPEAQDEVPHRHNFQEILWVKSGQGRHVIDGRLLEISPLTFYLIAKGQVHQFRGGYDLDGFLLRFTDDFLLASSVRMTWNYRITLFNNATSGHAVSVSQTEYRGFRPLIAMMIAEFEQADDKLNQDILRHLLLTLLLKLERTLQASTATTLPSNDPQVDLYHAFIQMLDQRYQRSHLVADYANALGVTSRQLSRISKRFVGRNAKQLIEERLVLDAKRYLRNTNYSIKEMAFALGFRDPSYFSRVFKRQTGITPQAYRG